MMGGEGRVRACTHVAGVRCMRWSTTRPTFRLARPPPGTHPCLGTHPRLGTHPCLGILLVPPPPYLLVVMWEQVAAEADEVAVDALVLDNVRVLRVGGGGRAAEMWVVMG